MSLVPSLKLNSGYQIPQIAFGTFDAPKDDVIKSVEYAIDTGFRHIDCAIFYNNEVEVGQAIAAGMKKNNLKREELFYLDLYLIHWPMSFQHKKDVPFDAMDSNTLIYEHHKIEDTWKAMEQLVTAGLVKSIGVSNFNKRQIERIIAQSSIAPAVNQVEVNLHWLNEKLIEFCHSKNIHVEAYAPLGSPGFMKGQVQPLVQQPNVVEIAQKHNKTPGQVLLRHALQRGIVVLTKSVTPDRIASNFEVFDFMLTKDEMEKLNKTGMNQRIFHVPAFAKHPEYPFHDEY
uniref:Aldo_ket_red domain-containing protein n=1 Tax=Rodentolepis nana TaxID=102285 RepID=A0A0R3TUN2_RODNA